MSSMFKENPVMYAIYWAALKKESLQEWAEQIRRMYGDKLDYHMKEAVELIEKYQMKSLY